MKAIRTATRRGPTLADLVALVGAAAVGLGVVGLAAPGRAGPMLIVAGPLAGIWWSRARGGSAAMGGLWGGVAYAIGCLIYLFSAASGAAGVAMRSSPAGLAFMVAACVAFGLAMGVAAGAMRAALGSMARRTDAAMAQEQIR